MSTFGFAAAVQPEAAGITGADVISHLNRTIAWYGHVSATDQTAAAPQNLVLQDNVQQSSKQVVRTAFAFAHAQAAFLTSRKESSDQTAAGTHQQARTLEQSAAAANDRIQRLQKEINGLNQEIAKAPKRKLATMVAQRDTLTADLGFAKLMQAGLKDMLQFANGAEKSGGLSGQINLLATSDSVPAALSDTPIPAAAAPHPAQSTAAFHPGSAGIAGLIANCYSLLRARSQIDTLSQETRKLSTQVVALRAPLRSEIRELITQGDAIADTAANEPDPNNLSADRQKIEQLSTRFKAFSGPILPLSEQGLALENTQGALAQWSNATGNQLQTVLGYLAFRLGTLALAVIVLLGISEAVRRATFRYVRDTRRRRQFLLIRRVAVGVVTMLIVLLSSVSGLGSFATVAGFVTAGLAVALQNVILSVVAYFFLIGRYGLRAGDRVTVSGITGQVIEVGLVRMYLMELAGIGTDLHSTGRVAVFSNSVIFQPSALIKQAPGTEYAWNSVSVTLSAETDLEQARKRVAQAVERVYQKYAQAIENQHEAFERTANIQLADPAPVSRVSFNNSGLEVTVRYPVEIQRMAETDERVIEAVKKETELEPPLKLAPGGYPKVTSAT